MLYPQTPSEYALYSTVKIDTESTGGDRGIGTGFFYNIPYDSQNHIPILVTNKHVVAGAETGEFLLHWANSAGDKPSGKAQRIIVENFERRWIPHPRDDVDLCAMPIAAIHYEAKNAGWKPFYIPISEDMIHSDQALAEEYSAVEEVFMFGYPEGLWDSKHGLPLVRRGTTASHPAVDYCGDPTCVVDIACYPGSSGSPVFLLSEGLYYDKKSKSAKVGARTTFLGVLFAGPQTTISGSALRAAPVSTKPKVYAQAMMHLGFVIKAKEVKALGTEVRARLATPA